MSATLIHSYDQSWTLDALGNWRQFSDDSAAQTRGVNAANEITSTSGIATPQYDRAGNMLSDGTRHYKYDAWNRMVAVYEDDGDGVYEPGTDDTQVASYEYDAANRRIEKAVTAAGGGPSHEHYFYNNQWQMLEERSVDGEGATISSNQYVWSPRYIDAPVVRYHDGNGDGDLLDAGDNVRYYSTDANHNVTATIDAASGDVVECYVYTAYGAALAYDADWDNPAAPATDGPLYCGYWFDAETGLNQVRNRYYSSALGTFVSRDPIGYFTPNIVAAGQIGVISVQLLNVLSAQSSGRVIVDGNLYRYVADTPNNLSDPSGLWSIFWPPSWPIFTGPTYVPPAVRHPIKIKPVPGAPVEGEVALKAANKWVELQGKFGTKRCQCDALKASIRTAEKDGHAKYAEALKAVYVANCFGSGLP